MNRRRLFMTLFLFLDRLGLHLLPKHYYSPIPDYHWLERNRDLWAKRASLRGLEWNLDSQLDWLRRVCMPYLQEVRGLRFHTEASRQGPGFGPIESQVLHCFIRAQSPRRIIEIGSGVSTACMLHASRLNEKPSEIISIDPYAPPMLNREPVTVIRKPVQAIPPEFFSLHAGDLLFIDSTHAVKTGSDVIHIYLNVIPSLSPDVFVHVHDISLPYAYPRHVFTHVWGWQESALCLALLTGNRALQVLCCLSALHYDRTDELRDIVPDYVPQRNVYEGLGGTGGYFPNSLWLKTREVRQVSARTFP